MPNDSWPKKVMDSQIPGANIRGGQRKKWIHNVKKDLEFKSGARIELIDLKEISLCNQGTSKIFSKESEKKAFPRRNQQTP